MDRGCFFFTHLGFVLLRVCEAGRVGGGRTCEYDEGRVSSAFFYFYTCGSIWHRVPTVG